ncbi:polysaccharide deacetylase family protein [Brevibacterium luteolum]|uniref:NodB homology domain-containing protein n=1 Tax=Brevibacterium luteolum TaxID=199591 RepID=A0A6G8KV36_9MICO|nr:polysaccharide deacetylase family protein [Brevibacterium luteolum]QIN28455.1 hypothetical protein EW640_03565 [Brevibacterium luteolum]
MSRRPRAAVASAAIAALLLSGCASNGTSREAAAQVTALADGRTPFAAAAEPADVLGQRHESDSPDYTLRFPEVRGAEAFNRKISDFVSELRRQRLPESESSGAGGKKPVPGEYELDWQVTQNCRSHVSFLLHDRSTLPGAGPEAYYTKVLDRDAGTEIPAAELFTKAGQRELATHVLEALQRKGYRTSAHDAAHLSSVQVEAITTGTTVDGHGGLVTHLGSGIVNARGDDSVAVSFTGDQARDWLTAAGREWLNDSAPGPQLKAGQKIPEHVTRDRNDVDCAETKCVALTYDDGPGEDTPQLLDALAAEGVPATFFVKGTSIAGNEATLKRIAEEGHEIGSHTWNHPQLTKISRSAAEREHARINGAIEKVTGEKPTVFRPPYGAFAKGVPDGGLPSIIWSLDTNDWQNKKAPEKTVKAATTDVRPGDIILMHDIHKPSVEASPQIIAKLKAQGFTLVTVSELFGGELKPGQSYYSDERMEGSRHIPRWAG